MGVKPLIKQEHNNRFITECQDAYRTYTDIDYAVMISGPWGCGKTQFVREGDADLSRSIRRRTWRDGRGKRREQEERILRGCGRGQARQKGGLF